MTVLARLGLVLSSSAQLAEACSDSVPVVPVPLYNPAPLVDNADTIPWSSACCAVLEVSPWPPCPGRFTGYATVPACSRLFSRPLGEYTVAAVEPPSDATIADCDDNLTASDDKPAAVVAWPTAGTYGRKAVLVVTVLSVTAMMSSR